MSDNNPSAARVASQFLSGELHRQGIAHTKTAFGGDSLIEHVINVNFLHKLTDELEEEHKDSQSAELAREVYQKLWQLTTLKPNEMGALNRLRNSIAKYDSWDASTQRNNIFKAADLLGIKLPSYMFASTGE